MVGDQYVGYQDQTLAAKDVLVRVWIRFVERCPPVAVGFSIKIHGIENKEIMGRCRPDEWVTLEYEMRVDRLGRDHNFVILLFNGVTQRQEIQIAKFDVYAEGKGGPLICSEVKESFLGFQALVYCVDASLINFCF